MKIMKILGNCVFLLSAIFLLSACAVFGDKYTSIPPPQGGLVLPINRSPGVWAECWLFQGRIQERNLIASTNKGQLIFRKKPLKHFTINPPKTQNYRRNVVSTAITVPLLLSARPVKYTLFVIHKNFRGWVVKTEIHRFKTSGYPFNDYYRSAGRKIYADKVIKLARVKPYGYRQFRFHRIYYPGHTLMDALGFPSN
ncbi:MAG: hypothetical protein U9P63_03820 [Patescibacteria group bacterium]|nr:hypothetical protein [Patescibacteria group bacterium]